MAITAVWGNDCILKINGQTLICPKSFRIEPVADTIEIASHTGYSKKFAYQAYAYTLAVDGAIAFTDGVEKDAFYEVFALTNFVEKEFILGFIKGSKKKYYSGTVLINSAQLSAAVNEHASFSMQFQGSGDLIESDSACFSEIGVVSHVVGVGGDTDNALYNITLTGISAGTTAIEYSVAGASRVDSGYDSTDGTSITFAILVPRHGTRTIYFYPMCEDGEGFAITDTITVL